MKDNRVLFSMVVATIGLGACGKAQQQAPDPVKPELVAAEKAQLPSGPDYTRVPSKAGAPFSISYRVIGTPVVGSPVSLELQLSSAYGSVPVEIAYQINDETALELPEAQPRLLTLEAAANQSVFSERVTVVPLREGRMYINVSAAVETEDGRTSTVISIPLHVGDVDTGLVEQGDLQTSEDGETTRVLTSE